MIRGLVALLMCWIVAGCDVQDSEPLCLEDCTLCGETGCVPERCGLLVIVSSDCEGEFDFAEVAVDQCLEPEVVTPGNRIITCATLEEGEERMVTVRGDGWIWRTTATCTNARLGSMIPVANYCMAANE